MHSYLGIEIGGTKLQLAVGNGNSPELRGFWRTQIDASAGAIAIREQILAGIPVLLEQTGISRNELVGIGIGFGGPVDTERGTTLLSHQVHGWDNFPLRDWAREHLGLPAVIHNDADTAAFAEAKLGAGRGFDPVLYVTVGSGIGGGLIHGGRIYRGSGLGAVEIGHLRPGHLPRHHPLSDAGETIEQIASGFGITQRARKSIADWDATVAFAQAQHRPGSPLQSGTDPVFQQRFSPRGARFAVLRGLAGGDASNITTAMVAQAAVSGDQLSLELLSDATYALGWGLGQAVTLLNPGRIVIGGGVSLIGEELFFGPVRRVCQHFSFGPFSGRADIVPAELGEEVVIYGAVSLAAATFAVC